MKGRFKFDMNQIIAHLDLSKDEIGNIRADIESEDDGAVIRSRLEFLPVDYSREDGSDEPLEFRVEFDATHEFGCVVGSSELVLSYNIIPSNTVSSYGNRGGLGVTLEYGSTELVAVGFERTIFNLFYRPRDKPLQESA